MITCGSCGERNPDGFRFCGFCGAELAGAGPRTEERRLVTVLFCDLVGFTERSDRADPEDVRAMLVPYHALLKREIVAFGGTLDKFIGDGALGVFGAPTAHEDDAERAVRLLQTVFPRVPQPEAVDCHAHAGEPPVVVRRQPLPV